MVYWELAINGKICEFFDSYKTIKERANHLKKENPNNKISIITDVMVIHV